MAEIVSKYIASKTTEPEVEKQEDASTETTFTKPKTLFHAIDKSALPSHEKTPLRLMQEGLTVLFAGGETGSRLLAHTVFHLLSNPEILEKAKKEVLEAAGDSNQLPDVKVLEGLPWLV
jgi:cytochrome P450